MKLKDNTILITGGTSGIGRSLAESFYNLGNRVIVTGRRQALLKELTLKFPGMEGIQLDHNNQQEVDDFGREMALHYPTINVLIANAGISKSENINSEDWSINDAESIVMTNILGVLRITAAILPILKTNSNATVLATSSALAFIPNANFPTYCASKAFLHSWLQSLRHQLRFIPVEVLELCPPYVRTELTGSQQASDPRAMPLVDFVAEVLEIIKSKRYLNGEILLEKDYARRWAERDGQYTKMFEVINPD